MKKLLKGIFKLILFVFLLFACFTGIDYYRMNRGKLPVFQMSSYYSKTRTQTFHGPFYTASRVVRASPLEELNESSDISFHVFSLSLKVSLPVTHEEVPFLVETLEKDNCQEPSVLYYADLNQKVYTYCLDQINIMEGNQKNSLFSLLGTEISIMDDLYSHLAYMGILGDGKTLKYHSREDSTTNHGLTIYQCQDTNINDIYIGPAQMEFQKDFCTLKDDDFLFLYEISDETPSSLQAVLDDKGNVIPEVFFEDETYRYEFDLPKTSYVFVTTPTVRGIEGKRIPLMTILNGKILSIDDLEKKGLSFNKIDKAKELEEKIKKEKELNKIKKEGD